MKSISHIGFYFFLRAIVIAAIASVFTNTSQAAVTEYSIAFSGGAGGPTQGVFSFDTLSQKFTKFDIVWNGKTLNIINSANSPVTQNSYPYGSCTSFNAQTVYSAITGGGQCAGKPLSLTWGIYPPNPGGGTTTSQLSLTGLTSERSGFVIGGGYPDASYIAITSSGTLNVVPVASQLLSLITTGNGSVTSTPTGISCRSNCSASFASGSSVTLSANPDVGNTFTAWSGACTGSSINCTVSMTAAQNVTATFNALSLVVSRFKDNGDGTVTDPTTGLIWMRCAMGQTWAGGTCTGTAKAFNWVQANALTGTFTAAGQSNWRLPNIRELLTIADLSKFKPAIDSETFPNTPSMKFWSDSPYVGGSDHAWCIYFDFGADIGLTDVGSFLGDNHAVRLVRGEKSSGLLDLARPSADYVDHGDGSATHTPTGLMWQRCAVGQMWDGGACSGLAYTFRWEDAKLQTSNLAGKADWRLPTEEELLSLVDYSRYEPAINTSLFPNTPNTKFWSDTPNAQFLNSEWNIAFGYGDVTYNVNGAGQHYAVRLVRKGQPIVTFALSVAKTGNGTVNSNPAAINCGSTCSASFTSGTNITLTATPDAGSTFTGWSGACAGSGSCVLTMNAAKSVVATFKAIPFTVATTGVAAGVISAGVATVTNKITFNSTDVGKTGSVFVTAVVPSSFLNNLSSAGATLRAMAVAAVGENTATSNLVLVQLTSTGWKQVVNGQLIPYSTGVLGDQLAAQTILTNTNTSSLPGAQFCVGYGTSAAEMSEAGRMQLVATVPDASATSASRQSCLVTDTLQVQTGWNLLGNSRNQSAQVSGLYSDSSWVTSVWKWDAVQKRWQFYSPSMDTAAMQSLITDKGYGVLSEIKPGDGYWVQATAPASVVLQSGATFNLTSATLSSGWNLVTTATSQTPAALNASLGSLTSLWAWDGTTQAWYFYAPSLDSGPALADYARTNGYLDFAATGKTLGSGVGFWVRRP